MTHATTGEKSEKPGMIHVVLSSEQVGTIIDALYEKLADTERYLIGHSENPGEPKPEEICCGYHRMQYEHQLELGRSFFKRKRHIKQLIAHLDK